MNVISPHRGVPFRKTVACRKASLRIGVVLSSPRGMAKKIPMLLLAAKILETHRDGYDGYSLWGK
jgi:hypothetical protein